MQDNRFGWDAGNVVWDFSDAEEWAKEHDRIEAMSAKKNVAPVDDEEEDEDNGEWWRKHLDPRRKQNIDGSAVLDGFCHKAAGMGVNPFASRPKTASKKKGK